MMQSLPLINYLAMAVTTVVGFLLGWLWYSPVLFGKAWMAEMKITEEMMKQQCAEKGMAGYFIKGFVFTALSTFALAWLITAVRAPDAITGAKYGVFVGLLIVGARMLNGSVWEQKSAKLVAINIGHEVVLFALQGAILGAWR